MNNKKIKNNVIGILLITITFLTIITMSSAQTIIEKEKADELKEAIEDSKAVLDTLKKQFESIDTTKKGSADNIAGWLMNVLESRDYYSWVKKDYGLPEFKELKEKDRETKEAIVKKLKEIGLDLSKKKIVIDDLKLDEEGNILKDKEGNVEYERKKLDFTFLYKEDEYIIKESLLLWKHTKNVLKHPATKWTGISLGSIVAIILLIIIWKTKGGWGMWMRRRPRKWLHDLKLIFKHRLFFLRWWRKWKKTYKRYYEFLYHLEKLYGEKDDLIKKNMERMGEFVRVGRPDPPRLYEKKIRKEAHRWVKWDLKRIEHINKEILKKIKVLGEFTEKELPKEEKEIIRNIENEANAIRNLESGFFAVESGKLGGKKYITTKERGKRYLHSGTIKIEGGAPVLDATGKYEKEKTMTELNRDVHRQIELLIQENVREREAIEKVLDPTIKKFIRYLALLYNKTAAEEKCIEVEANQLDALSTGKVHSSDIQSMIDIVEENAKKKEQYFKDCRLLINENTIKEKLGSLDILEEYLERIEGIKKRRLSFVEEQMNRRLDKGKGFKRAKKPLPIKGKNIPEIKSIRKLHQVLQEGKFDEVLEKGKIKVTQTVRGRAYRTPWGKQREEDREVEMEQNVDLNKIIDIIAEWMDDYLDVKDLAENIRQAKKIDKRDWKGRKRKIMSEIERKYPIWFGHTY